MPDPKYLLLEKFNKDSFSKNVVWIASGTAAAQAITILCTPVATRLYSPADFGVLTVFAAVIGIIGQLSTLRYSVTIPLADDEALAGNVLKLCFLITFVLSLFLGVIVFLFGSFLAAKFSASHAAPYLWLLPVCLFGTGLYEALSSWAIREKNFKLIARTNLTQGVSSSGIKIGLGWLGIKPLGLLLGLLASQMAGSGSLFFKLINEKPFVFQSISWKGIVYAAKRFSRFPLLQFWSRLLLSLGAQLPSIFMATFYGVEIVGLFGLAYSMVNLPMNLLGASVAQVYYAEIATYGKSRPDKIHNLSISVIKKMFFVGIIPIGALMTAGPWMFSLVFGVEWHDAGVYAKILSVLIMGQFVSTPIMHCLDVLERQGLQFFLNVIRILLVVSVFMLCVRYGLSSKSTVLWYSVLFFAYYIAVVTIVMISLARAKKKTT